MEFLRVDRRKREPKLGKEEHWVTKGIIVKHRADFIQTAKSPGHKHSVRSDLARYCIIRADYR